MKKVLYFLLMLLMASVAHAIEVPDPVITVTEGEEYYIVDVEVEGDYGLRVFNGNWEIETPYVIQRLEEDVEYHIMAYAEIYSEGSWYYSNVVDYWLLVPALEETPLPGPPPMLYFDVIEGDEYYTVFAYSDDDHFTVSLFCDGVPVDNPYSIERSPDGDMLYELTAWGQAEGYNDITDKITLVVPGIVKPITGDLNGDGEVNIADVNAVIDAILGQNSEKKYDFDGDGEVTISDVMALINYLM